MKTGNEQSTKGDKAICRYIGRNIIRRVAGFVCSGVVLFSLGIATVEGQVTHTWTGDHNSNDWSRHQNWSSAAKNSTPGADSHVEVGSGFVNTANPNLNQDSSFQTFTIDATGIHPNFTITGANTMTLLAGTLTRTAASTGNQTFAFDELALGSDATWTIDGSGSLTVSSVISGSQSLFVQQNSGDAILILSGDSTFSGGVTLDSGVLAAGHINALGSGGLTMNGGVLRLDTSEVAVSGLAGGADAVIRNADGVSAALRVNQTGESEFSGMLTDGSSGSMGLTVDGTGRLILSGANDYSGGTTVAGGVLNIAHNNALGSAGSGATVNEGAVLELGGGIEVSDQLLTLNGGTLRGVEANNWWLGNINLGDDSRIELTDEQLVIGNLGSVHTMQTGTHQVEVDTAGGTTAWILSDIVGDGGITKTGTGRLVFFESINSYTGDTRVNEGLLELRTNPFLVDGSEPVPTAFGGNLYIGDGVGDRESAIARWGFPGTNTNFSDIVPNTTDVWIASDGLLDLNGHRETIRNLTFEGGKADLGPEGVLTVNGEIVTNGHPDTVWITGVQGENASQLHLGGDNRVFNIAPHPDGESGLTVDIQVVSGGVVKEGEGILTFESANTFGQKTVINEGILNIRHSQALGQHGGGSVAAGTEINSGGQLQLETLNGGPGLLIEQERLTLNGIGPDGSGALRSIEGENTWGGIIRLGSDARVQSDAGELSLTGSIAGVDGSQSLVIGGSGDTRISGVVSGLSGLTKDGSGTLTLSGQNLYAGVTTISEGIVNIRHSWALGSTVGGTTVANGAELQLQGGIEVPVEALTLSGTGVAGGGALRNVSGNNSWAGAISLSDASRINSDQDTLTLNGNITGSGQALTIGGAGNTTISGAIQTGIGSLTKDGSGTLTLSGNNTFTGDTVVNSGTLTLGADNVLSNSTAVMIASGGTFSVGERSDTIRRLTGTGSVTFSGGSLTLAGSETMTFGGQLGFGSGTFTIGSGIDFTLGTSQVNASGLSLVLGGGTLNLGAGLTHTFNTLTVTQNSILDFGGDATVWFDNVYVEEGALLEVRNWVDGSSFFYSSNQNPGDQGMAPLNRILFLHPENVWTVDDTRYLGDAQISPVPEPSTYGAIFMGLSLLFLGYRRFRKRAVVEE